jgi:hypothetical protein
MACDHNWNFVLDKKINPHFGLEKWCAQKWTIDRFWSDVSIFSE